MPDAQNHFLLDRFNSLMIKSLNWPLNKGYPNNIRTVVLNLLALSTGLPICELVLMRWEDIMENVSESEVEAKDFFYIRRYKNCIHPSIRRKIEECYVLLEYPKITSQIVPSSLLEDGLFLVGCLFVGENVRFRDFLKQKSLPINPKLIETIYQVTFGRKVIEICGFTKQTSQDLRRHFKFKTNQEILTHLSLSKEQAQFDISKLNLYAPRLFKIENKNFDNGSKFQGFITLSSFLSASFKGFDNALSSSIKCLLWISLLNGIKMSSLLKLKIFDVEGFDEDTNNTLIVNWNNKKLVISKELNEFLNAHISRYGKTQDMPLFQTNRGNTISSSSLLRELRKVMKLLGHKHAEKFIINTPLIAWGRRIIEVKGDHPPTIIAMRKQLGFNSKKDLFEFLELHNHNPKKGVTIEGNYVTDIYKAIAYDL